MPDRLSIPSAQTALVTVQTSEDRERGRREAKAMITPEWYRFLKALADAVNTLNEAP